MQSEKQQLVLEYLISSSTIFALATDIIKPEYFDPEFRATVKFIQKYHDDYSAVPSVDQILAETNLSLNKQKLTQDRIEYCLDEIEAFCQIEALKLAVLKCAKQINDGDTGDLTDIIEDASTISLKGSTGLSLFDDPLEALDELEKNPPISTGYKYFDDALGGGARRKQQLLLSANSGGGKSIMMANLGLNFATGGLNVLYISLELSVHLVFQRYASMISGISSRELKNRREEVAVRMSAERSKVKGELFIEYMPVGTTANNIRALLKEYEIRKGIIPDVLIIDYIDLMGANERMSADNVFEKDKSVSEQLRQVLVDYNMIGVTASQQNRSAVDAVDLNHSHIAGGISKINTTDNYVSIIFNEIMRAAGTIMLKLLKTRSSDGVGKMVPLCWNNTSLRITEMADSKVESIIAEEVSRKKKGKSNTNINVFQPPAADKKISLTSMFKDDFKDDFGLDIGD